MRYLLLTRPRQDSERLAEIVHAKGYTPLIEPLLTPAYYDDEIILPSHLQGILITSQHALKSLEASQQLSKLGHVPLICVGQKTTDLACALGLDSVVQGGETVDELMKWVQEHLNFRRGSLLYMHGDVITKDLKEPLGKCGFSVYTQEVYEMQELESFSPETQDFLSQNRIKSVVFFSPRTGRIFAAIARKFQNVDCFSDMTAFCLSDNVAKEISHMAWNEVKIPKIPHEELLLELL